MHVQSLTVYALLPLLVAFQGAMAQSVSDEEPVPPLPDPLQIRLPANTRAEVSVTRTQALTDTEAADPIRRQWYPDLQKASYLRDERNLSVDYEWEGGKKSSAYRLGGQVVFSASLRFVDDIRTGGAGAPDWSRSDFPEAGWISLKDYAGRQTVGGRTCYVFDRRKGVKDVESRRARIEQHLREQGITDPAAVVALGRNMLEGEVPTGRVWLDTKTLLPIQVEEGAMLYRYTYKAAPEQKVIPTGIYKRFLESKGG